jgi:acyl-CoA synthetase (AMP-forming)/AMP-acid ligase II
VLLTEEKLRPLAIAAGMHASEGVKVLDIDDLPLPRAPFELSRDAVETDVAQIYYTSGTTGRSRGVVLTHRNIGSHALMAIAELRITDGDVWAHVAPMFHLADAWAVFAITWAGGRHIMFPDFEPRAVLDGFEGHGVTITNLVPTMMNRLVHEPDIGSRRFLDLRAVLSGGAPIAPALVERVIGAFRADYVQTYGLTESSPYLTFSTLKRSLLLRSKEERLRYLSRTGRPAIGVDLRVVGDDGKDVPRDDASVGEIRVKAPWVTPGYWRNEEATAAAFEDGWFKTGDLATWDEEGYVNIVDRKKDMIITGGEKVFSVEVEAALAAHPSVFESAVVGVPDEDWGEKVTAAVVPKGATIPGASELALFLRERLASFKVPKLFVLVDHLPKTGSAKIRKQEVREMLLAVRDRSGIEDLRKTGKALP